MALAEEGRNNCQMSYTGHGRYSIQMIYIQNKKNQLSGDIQTTTSIRTS